METKICSKCKKELPATREYRYTSKTTKDWWYSSCKECKNKVIHEYIHTEEYRENRKLRWKKYREYLYQHRKEKWYNRIHKRAKRRIDETIWRPKICPICWELPTRIIAHHPDYSKWYEIVFCCTQCHDKIHKWKITDYEIINLLELDSQAKAKSHQVKMPTTEKL